MGNHKIKEFEVGTRVELAGVKGVVLKRHPCCIEIEWDSSYTLFYDNESIFAAINILQPKPSVTYKVGDRYMLEVEGKIMAVDDADDSFPLHFSCPEGSIWISPKFCKLTKIED